VRLFDTHCHPLWRDAEDPAAAQLERARAAGVQALLCVATDPASARGACELAQRFPGVVAASAGLHPNDAGDGASLPAMLEDVAALARTGDFAAIGETGLDFYRDRAAPELQEKSLLFHLELARELDLPVILHCRAAAARLAEVLDARAPLRGVMHCYSEGPEMVGRFLSFGLHVSFAGNLTYPKSTSLREACVRVPRERLLIETDAPFLAPQPQRGRPNEPAFIRHTLEALAAARGEAPEDTAQITFDNARSLFRFG
jgi:TatD DNase family protein